MARKKLVDEMSQPALEKARQTQEYKEFQKKYKKLSDEQGGGIVPMSKMPKDMREEMTKLSVISREEKRRNTLALNTSIETIMQLPLMDDDAIRIVLEQRGIEDDKITEAMAMCYGLAQRARVDTRSFEVLRDTIGQKPIERQEVLSAEINTNDILRRHFGNDN